PASPLGTGSLFAGREGAGITDKREGRGGLQPGKPGRRTYGQHAFLVALTIDQDITLNSRKHRCLFSAGKQLLFEPRLPNMLPLTAQYSTVLRMFGNCTPYREVAALKSCPQMTLQEKIMHSLSGVLLRQWQNDILSYWRIK